MDENLKRFLVADAKRIVEHQGIEALIGYRHRGGACGCLGPQNGEPLCSCGMSVALEQHLMTVVNEIDPEAALTLLRARIIYALRG